MKILFISSHLAEKPMGAKTLAKSHYELLCNIYGVENVELISIKTYSYEDKNDDYNSITSLNSKFEGIRNIISGRPYLINKITQAYILEKCRECELVFVDNYSFGKLIKRIKKELPIPVVVFFHGIYIVEGNAWRKNKRNNIGSTVVHWDLLKNEKDTVKYADKIMVLNKRDAGELYQNYGRSADLLFPMIISDTARIAISPNSGEEFRILFVGGLFGPNIQGITWFAKEVMPQLDDCFHLYIIGNGMETLQEQDIFTTEQIHVIGRVENLDDWYNDANVVIGPIFSGDGMKTKTAEALMYGKVYLGTAEALCGYDDLDDYLCNTKEEFIDRIRKLHSEKVDKFNSKMRDIFLKKYSIDAMQGKIAGLLDEAIKECK